MRDRRAASWPPRRRWLLAGGLLRRLVEVAVDHGAGDAELGPATTLHSGLTATRRVRSGLRSAAVDLTIRTARPDDLDALRAIYRRSALSNPGDRDALLARPAVLVWNGAGIETGHTRVALAGDEPVGFATTVPRGDEHGAVGRRARQGAGRAHCRVDDLSTGTPVARRQALGRSHPSALWPIGLPPATIPRLTPTGLGSYVRSTRGATTLSSEFGSRASS